MTNATAIPATRRQKKPELIVWDCKTGECWCKGCDARYQPPLPCTIDMFVVILKQFGRDHRRCKVYD